MLRYTRYSERRRRTRGISRADVEETVRNPDVTYPAKKPGRVCHTRDVGNRRLKVVFERHGADEVVITTYYIGEGE
jgi:hypothetical protein